VQDYFVSFRSLGEFISPRLFSYLHSTHKWHPTWDDSNEFITQTKFGGTLLSKCGICNNDLSHLITIPKAILSIDKELNISTCLTCLGWEEHQLFYQYIATERKFRRFR
jgi:hypothetical protein